MTLGNISRVTKYDLQIFLLMLILWFASCSACFAGTPIRNFQWGIGFGGQHLNDYRGSREFQSNALPFPVVLFESKFLKIDEEEGVSAQFFQTQRYEINISGDLALRSSSDQNRLRQDMPILDTAAELGPSLNVLLSGQSFEHGWTLRFPLRAVVAANFDDWQAKGIGYTFNPELTFKRQNVLPKWSFKLALGSVFGSEAYHDYYYSIASRYVTTERQYYQAKSGFGGVFSEVSLSGKYPDWLFEVGLRYDNLAGANFIESDLVATKHYWSFGIGAARLISIR